MKQQMAVYATFTDGTVRDVTAEAFLDSSNTEVATVNRQGTADGRPPRRIDDSWPATKAPTPPRTIVVMGDRTGYAWKDVGATTTSTGWSTTSCGWSRSLPSGVCTDAEFIRRVYLDLTGLQPQPDEVRAFLADPPAAARQARRVGGQADRQPRIRRSLDQQMGRSARREPQVPRRAGGRGLPRMDPQGRRRQHALRPVRPRHPDRPAARTSTTRRPAITRSCATRKRRWRTRRSSSWPCASTATSATTIRSSAGRRTSITTWPPSSPRSIAQEDPRSRARSSAAPTSKAASRSSRSSPTRRPAR